MQEVFTLLLSGQQMRKVAVSKGKAMLSTMHGDNAKDKSDYPTQDFTLVTSKVNVVNACKYDISSVTVCWINMFLKVTGIKTGGKKSIGTPRLRQINDSNSL